MLLKSCLSASKLLHTLRSSHCEGHGLLYRFNDLQSHYSLLCRVCNVSLTVEQWLQASFPRRNKGLAVRRVSSLASSAFLASAVKTRQLQDQLLGRRTGAHSDDDFGYLYPFRIYSRSKFEVFRSRPQFCSLGVPFLVGGGGGPRFF